MRPGAIAVTGAVVLALIFLFLMYMVWMPLFLAGLVLVLVVRGLLLRGPREFVVHLPTFDASAPPPVIHGVTWPPLGARATCQFRSRNRSILLGTALVCTAIVLIYFLTGNEITAAVEIREARYLLLYALTYVPGPFVVVAGIWSRERLLLQQPDLAFGHVQAHEDKGLLGTWTRYEFRDSLGGFHGDTKRNHDHLTGDTAVMTFVRPGCPGWNKPSWSLFFHRILIEVSAESI